MRRSPTATAKPSLRQGGHNAPLTPSQSPPSEYREERPSILSLFLVVLLTFSFIVGLVAALFLAYAHEIEQRPLPTVPPTNASTEAESSEHRTSPYRTSHRRQTRLKKSHRSPAGGDFQKAV
ncbi:hypothetical protein MTO96_014601 [Rhipicephalus appendiculatus]